MAASSVAVVLAIIFLYLVALMLVTQMYLTGLALSGKDPTSVLDPMNLSIGELKSLLYIRGYPEPRSFEKQDYVNAVRQSGPVKIGDIDGLYDELAESSSSGHVFTSDEEFYEIVEDTKDSVWLVQVVKGRHAIDKSQWIDVVQQMGLFGVRTGNVDCVKTPRFCRQRNWNRSQLLIALPRGYNKIKADIFITQYNGSPKSDSIISWISDKLSSRVQVIENQQEDLSEWLDFRHQIYLAKKYPVQMIYFTANNHIPIAYSALSIKYTGRIRFGICMLNKTTTGENDLDGHFLIATRSWNITFDKIGYSSFNNYRSMDLFLKTIMPDVNDIFIFTLLIINTFCISEALIYVNRRFIDRVLRFIWKFFQLNLIVILSWIPVSAVLGLWPLNVLIVDYTLRLIRFCSVQYFMDIFRWFVLKSARSFILVWLYGIFTTFCVAIGYGLWKNTRVLGETRQTEFRSWLNILFHRTEQPNIADIEDGNRDVEDLLEDLSSPNFWLRPRRSLEYINGLPRWKHIKPGKTDGSTTDSKPKESFDQKECSICIEEYFEGTVLCGLPCGHTFHEFCVLQWLFRGNSICPTCRWPAYKSKPVKKHRE